MRFSVTVVDGASGQGQLVLIDAEPDRTISDLLPQLVSTVGGAPMHPSFAVRVGVWVDGRAVDRLATLRAVNLRPGSVLALHEPHGNRAGLPGGVAEIRAATGPGAGRVHRIGLGETLIGCGAAGLSLADVMLPADALTLRVTVDGVVTVTLGEGVEAFLEDKPLDGATTWPAAAYLRSGGTVLQLASPWEPDADVTPSQDRLGVDFNRPPRLLPAARERSFTLPAEPVQPRKMSIPWLMVFAPLAMVVPSYFFFGPRALLFGLMSPLMVLFNVASGKRQGARQYKEAKAQYDQDVATVQGRLTLALETERSDRRNATRPGGDPAQRGRPRTAAVGAPPLRPRLPVLAARTGRSAQPGEHHGQERQGHRRATRAQAGQRRPGRHVVAGERRRRGDGGARGRRGPRPLTRVGASHDVPDESGTNSME